MSVLVSSRSRTSTVAEEKHRPPVSHHPRIGAKPLNHLRAIRYCDIILTASFAHVARMVSDTNEFAMESLSDFGHVEFMTHGDGG